MKTTVDCRLASLGKLEIKLELGVDLGLGDIDTDSDGSAEVSFTGAFKLVFNSLFEEFRFDVPDEFLGLLDPGDPTTIVIPESPSEEILFITEFGRFEYGRGGIGCRRNFPTDFLTIVDLSTAGTWESRFTNDAGVIFCWHADGRSHCQERRW